MNIHFDILKVLTCLTVIGIAVNTATADQQDQKPKSVASSPNCVEKNGGDCAAKPAAADPARNDHMGAGPYDQYNDPSCTPNIPNCYTYEPSRNLTKDKPTK